MNKKSTLPSMQDILDYINNQEKPISKRTIARQFKIKGDNRRYLKNLLKEIEVKGLATKHGHSLGRLENSLDRCVVHITGTDTNGDLIGRPIKWDTELSPQILIEDNPKIKPVLGVGDIILCRLSQISSKVYQGLPLRRISGGMNQFVGVYYDGRIVSVNRRDKTVLWTDSSFPTDLENEDIILVDVPTLSTRKPMAHFIRKIASAKDAFSATIISMSAHMLPFEFPESVLQEAQDAKNPTMKDRKDLTHIPFITIDGEDAKDFDDAVFAEPIENGWHIMVGIADVAYYVRPNSALDKEAFKRGNSTYFPDRVVPMLPERLSNELCSLQPNKKRGAIVADMTIDQNGNLKTYLFYRAMIKSTGRFTYTFVEDYIQKNQETDVRINHLQGAYLSLLKARQNRNVLEINMPEMQVVLTSGGRVKDIHLRPQYESYKLIEEMMILANVASAKILQEKQMPVMYRVHERPSEDKLNNFKNYLMENKTPYRLSGQPSPKEFNLILHQNNNISMQEMILRTQSKAEYSPTNVGHYGLALTDYAHFTSPIRRYSDILIHRALITALNLGDGGLPMMESPISTYEKIATHISATERESDQAEMEAIDRYVAGFLADRIGEKFRVRVSSVSSFGLFVRLDDFMADGLIPISSLDGYFEYLENKQILFCKENKKTFYIGQMLDCILKECVPLTGGLIFSIIDCERKKRFFSRFRR